MSPRKFPPQPRRSPNAGLPTYRMAPLGLAGRRNEGELARFARTSSLSKVRKAHHADIDADAERVRFWGMNQTSLIRARMSAHDPKRTSGNALVANATALLEDKSKSPSGSRWSWAEAWEGDLQCIRSRVDAMIGNPRPVGPH